jgi:anti-sigma-K factor RskA
MTPDIHTLSGAYVLDAIEPDERDAFELHLAECVSCREEVDALRKATTALGESVAATPPPRLRDNLLAAIARTPQLPPVTRQQTEQSLPHRRRWVGMLAAAAAVLVVGGVGTTVVVRNDDDGPQRYTASQVFDAADVRTQTIAVGAGSVRVGLSQQLGVLAIDGSKMPPLPGHKVYQLWLMDQGKAISLAVMDHSAYAVEPIPASGSLGVTAEPPGGSTAPTSAPLLQLDPTTL